MRLCERSLQSRGLAALGTILAGLLFPIAPSAAQDSPAVNAADRPALELFAKSCAVCHGEGASGTERGPALVNNRSLRGKTADYVRNLIKTGTPGGMPAFGLPDDQLRTIADWVHSLNLSLHDARPSGDLAAGKQFFFGEGKCSGCHMVAGRGGMTAPDLSDLGRLLTLRELEQTLDDPATGAATRSRPGCPGYTWCPQKEWTMVTVHLKNGSNVRGLLRGEAKHEVQVQTADGHLHHLLASEYQRIDRDNAVVMPPLKATPQHRKDLIAYLSTLNGITEGPIAEADAIPPAAIRQIMNPDPGEWTNYHGTIGGNRHSSLAQVNLQNIAGLQLQWTAPLPYNFLEVTPLVIDGTMYVTAPNQVCALSARTGRQVWCYSRPRSPGDKISSDAAKGRNRGVAVLGDRVFFATDNGHMLCLNRLTGGLMWDVNMPQGTGPYGSTAAPLIVNDLVVSGIAGGDGPIRGFVVAYHANTGQEAWRFSTLPKPGDPAEKTWSGTAGIEIGGGATWMTGSYDPETGTLFWTTGNPYPDFDEDTRKGDNLYTNCVVALDAKTGQLRWYFQFTPQDLHDWDATQPLVLVNARFQGAERKLVMQANRNGFFYVLDRTNGKLLLAKPFVKKLNWASGIGADGRPQLTANNAPTAVGTVTCPGARGATNWYSPAFNPATRLFYVMAAEDCNVFRKSDGENMLGRALSPVRDPANPPAKYLRALDIETGKIVWEVQQVGSPEASYSGVLSTAGNLVFYGETGGSFGAVNAKTGESLWHFETGQEFQAGPMSYLVNGRQHVAIAAGSNILSFALPAQR